MIGAGLWPVVQRELRATSRRPVNHWIRLTGAALGIAGLWGFNAELPMSDYGIEVFTKLDAFLSALILFLLPALTADSIARERRDGTLGLLFMTPLTASEIVIGKVISRFLRVFAIWLGVLPILAICFVCGGIEPQDLCTLIMIHAACGMVALSAGLLASSLTQSRMAAFLFAFVLLGIFVQPIKVVLSSFDVFSQDYSLRYMQPAFFSLGLPGYGFQATAGGYSSVHAAFAILAEKNLTALLMLWASIRTAGYCIQRHWQDKPPSRRHLDFIKRYCTPLKQFSFRQKMRKTIESNPISWLQQYSWKARTTKWSLCLFFVAAESFTITGLDLERFSEMLAACVLLLFGACTFAGVNGFHYDKTSGALELILVTPLNAGQIIFGRIRGLWKLFLPSTAVLVGSIIYFDFDMHKIWYGRDNLAEIATDEFVLASLEIIIVYLTLPFVATSMALRFKRLAWSAVATTALAFGPISLLYCHRFTNGYYEWQSEQSLMWFLTSPVVVIGAQLLITRVAYKRLLWKLEKRRFAF